MSSGFGRSITSRHLLSRRHIDVGVALNALDEGRERRLMQSLELLGARGLGAQQRAKRIAVAAYFLAEQRAFAPNHELDDWLAAERSL